MFCAGPDVCKQVESVKDSRRPLIIGVSWHSCSRADVSSAVPLLLYTPGVSTSNSNCHSPFCSWGSLITVGCARKLIICIMVSKFLCWFLLKFQSWMLFISNPILSVTGSCASLKCPVVPVRLQSNRVRHSIFMTLYLQPKENPGVFMSRVLRVYRTIRLIVWNQRWCSYPTDNLWR